MSKGALINPVGITKKEEQFPNRSLHNHVMLKTSSWKQIGQQT